MEDFHSIEFLLHRKDPFMKTAIIKKKSTFNKLKININYLLAFVSCHMACPLCPSVVCHMFKRPSYNELKSVWPRNASSYAGCFSHLGKTNIFKILVWNTLCLGATF
jgi:hypothetical protein